MAEKRLTIDSSLTRKGFKKNTQNNHYYYKLIIDGKITNIRTKMSTGSNHKTIGDNLLVQMYKQLKMNNIAEFRKYIECTYSYESYIKSLKEKNYI
jgi:hypothetical protein